MTSRLCSMTTTVLPWSAQAVQHLEQHFDVLEMQAGGRFVEDVQRAAGVALGEFERQLDALRLAAGQRGRALAEGDVAEADIDQRLQLARDDRHGVEEFARLLDGHLQHVVDVLALVAGLPAFRGCSACRGRRRRARRCRAGSASRP
jgi:hypothetical protein